jgi:thioredoxin-related protein
LRKLVSILACVLSSAAFGQGIPLAHDLAREARDAQREGLPLVVFYTQPGCVYCERARRDYLQPLISEPAVRPRLRVVEVDVTSRAPLADFTGRRLSATGFARAQRVRIVPTLGFYGPGGERLVEPLVGLSVPDFYLAYLDGRLDEARKHLAPAIISRPPARAASATGGG